MLKGLLIAATVDEEWKTDLQKEGLAWVVPEHREKQDFLQALEAWEAKPGEVLCLVETDREERLALELGLFCVGWLNPDCPGEKLTGCRMLLEGLEEVDKAFLTNVHRRALGLPLQIAETSRLWIREMTLADLDALQNLYEESERDRFFPEYSEDFQEMQSRIQAYIQYMYGICQFGMWVLTEKTSGRLVGRAGFGLPEILEAGEIDLGYYIGKAYRRQGYAEEACRAVLEYARESLELKEICAYIDCENLPSLHLIEKLGFSREQKLVRNSREIYRYFL